MKKTLKRKRRSREKCIRRHLHVFWASCKLGRLSGARAGCAVSAQTPSILHFKFGLPADVSFFFPYTFSESFREMDLPLRRIVALVRFSPDRSSLKGRHDTLRLLKDAGIESHRISHPCKSASAGRLAFRTPFGSYQVQVRIRGHFLLVPYIIKISKRANFGKRTRHGVQGRLSIRAIVEMHLFE